MMRSSEDSNNNNNNSKNSNHHHGKNNDHHDGIVVLVTGANKGIGKEICRMLGKDPTVKTVLMACRCMDRCQIAKEDLEQELLLEEQVCLQQQQQHGQQQNDPPPVATATAASADSSTSTTTKKFHCIPYDLEYPDPKIVVDYISQHCSGQLNVLINNAAVCYNDPTLYGKVTYTPFTQQARITIQTNVIGTLRLTEALLPLLLQSSSSSNNNNNNHKQYSISKIINMASAAGRLSILKSRLLVEHFTSPTLTVPELESLVQDFVVAVELKTHASNGWPNTNYGMSKLALIAWTRILAREYDSYSTPTTTTATSSSVLMCNSVDPGYCATDQNNHQGVRPAADGALMAYLLATLPNDMYVTGKHWMDNQIIEW